MSYIHNLTGLIALFAYGSTFSNEVIISCKYPPGNNPPFFVISINDATKQLKLDNMSMGAKLLSIKDLNASETGKWIYEMVSWGDYSIVYKYGFYADHGSGPKYYGDISRIDRVNGKVTQRSSTGNETTEHPCELGIPATPKKKF